MPAAAEKTKPISPSRRFEKTKPNSSQLSEKIRLIIAQIPRGRVATYGDVASAAGFPRAARQVARALRNADQAGLPWHRVLGAGGAIRLPGEAGLEQRIRLKAEGVRFAGGRVDMKRHHWAEL